MDDIRKKRGLWRFAELADICASDESPTVAGNDDCHTLRVVVGLRNGVYEALADLSRQRIDGRIVDRNDGDPIGDINGY